MFFGMRMKKSFIIIIFILLPALLHGMYIPARTYQRARAATVRTQLPRQRVPAARVPTIQRRSIAKAAQLKQLTALKPEAQHISPAIGAALYESGALQKMHSTQSESPVIKLEHELFHQYVAEGPVTPTARKTNPAYVLNPSILGLIIGALESQRFNDLKTREDLIEQWGDEYGRIVHGKELKPKRLREITKKVNSFLQLIDEAYKYDKNTTLSLLLAFLWIKIDPESNHDIEHYLVSVNKYIPIFATEEKVERHEAYQSLSFMSKLKTMMHRVSNYFYTPKQHAILSKTVNNAAAPKDAIKIETAMTFEERVAAFVEKTEMISRYPHPVILSDVGFMGKIARPNCVEAAIQDVWNMILFNTSTKKFDLSLLPSSIKPVAAFEEFYALQNEKGKENVPIISQAFMNLVSNIPRVSYSMDNYELKGEDADKNFLILANYFLQTDAQNLEELGKLLSDGRRTITFELKQNVLINTPIETLQKQANDIYITIDDRENFTEDEMHFYFVPGHGWLDVPKRDKKIIVELLDPLVLAKKYHISPKAQALLSLQPDISILESIKHAMPASFYYIFHFRNDIVKNDEFKIAYYIITYSSDNTEATDYAYKLYEKLAPHIQVQLLPAILKSNLERKNEKFKNVYKITSDHGDTERNIILHSIIFYGQADPDALQYAYNFYKELPVHQKILYLGSILSTGIHKLDSPFADIYSLLKPETNKEKREIVTAIINHDIDNQEATHYAYTLFQEFLPREQILTLDKIFEFDEQNTNDYFRRIYEILKPKVDINAKVSLSPNNETTLLIMACQNLRKKTVKLLLENGAKPNISGKLEGKKITPLFAVLRDVTYIRDDIITDLIKHGVNINDIDSGGNTALDIALKQKKKNFLTIMSESKTVEILEKAGGQTHATQTPDYSKE